MCRDGGLPRQGNPSCRDFLAVAVVPVGGFVAAPLVQEVLFVFAAAVVVLAVVPGGVAVNFHKPFTFLFLAVLEHEGGAGAFVGGFARRAARAVVLPAAAVVDRLVFARVGQAGVEADAGECAEGVGKAEILSRLS